MSGDSYFTQWVLFWVLGLLNNTPGVVVGSAAKSISESFDKKGEIGLLYWANTALGLIVAILAGSLLLRFSTNKKMTAAFILSLSGIVITAIATKQSFYLAIGGILLIGMSSALGQATILGYGRFFNPLLVGGWSSGTGAAGIAGTGIYLLLKTVLHMTNLQVFCCFIPLCFIYFGAYILLSRVYAPEQLVDFSIQQLRLDNDKAALLSQYNDSEVDADYNYNDNLGLLSKPTDTQHHINSLNSQYTKKDGESFASNNPNIYKSSDDLQNEFGNHSAKKTNTNSSLFDTDGNDNKFNNAGYGTLSESNNSNNLGTQDDSFSSIVREQTKLENEKFEQIHLQHQKDLLRESWCTQFCRVFPAIWFRATMLMLIYFLEYVVCSLFANHAAPKTETSPTTWAYTNAYEVLSFCYQIGVFISRSSIGCIQFKHTWFLTALQGVNFIVWLVHTEVLFIKPYWLLFPAMIFVGLLAGACYVNTFYSLQNDTQLGRDKEFAINIVSIGISMGITLSSFFTLLADNTWLKKEVTP